MTTTPTTTADATSRWGPRLERWERRTEWPLTSAAALFLAAYAWPLRLVLLLRVLNRGATKELRGRIILYVSGATVLLLLTASLAELDAERHHAGANITSFGDALWWSLTTITTVGYGDRYPVTTEGRWVAAGLMVGGVALLGIVTASIASWLIERVRETEQQAQAATREDISALTTEITDLRRQLSALTDNLARANGAPQLEPRTEPTQ